MFLFGKKKQAQKVSERFRGLVDWHSHILPGVDDGVADMDEALAVLRAYERLGVREVWLTPHIMEDIPNSTASLRARFLELQQAYAEMHRKCASSGENAPAGIAEGKAIGERSSDGEGERNCVSDSKAEAHAEMHGLCASSGKNAPAGIAEGKAIGERSSDGESERNGESKDRSARGEGEEKGEAIGQRALPLSLRLGSENMLDGLFDERLESGDVLPLEGGRLLIETSYFTAPLAFRERVLAAKHRGFTPVLAHPERYIYMQPRDYDELKEMGVLFQQNLFSETGRYGSEARRRCLYLQQKGYYDLLGTDLHSIGALEDLVYQTRT